MSPEQLLSAAVELGERFPGCELVKNKVGNLAILVDGTYVGWIDLVTGEVETAL